MLLNKETDKTFSHSLLYYVLYLLSDKQETLYKKMINEFSIMRLNNTSRHYIE